MERIKCNPTNVMERIIEKLELECNPTNAEVTWSDNQLLTLIKDLYDEIARLRADHDLLVGQVQDLQMASRSITVQILEQVEHTQAVLQDSLEKQWESGR